MYYIERNRDIFLKKVQFIGHEFPLFSFNAKIPLIFEFGNNENTYYWFLNSFLDCYLSTIRIGSRNWMIHTWNMYLKRGTYIKCYFWQQTCRKCFQIKYIYIKYALLLPFTILFRKKMFSQKTDDQVQYLYKDVLIIIYYLNLTFVQILFVVFYIWPLLCMYVYEFF